MKNTKSSRELIISDANGLMYEVMQCNGYLTIYKTLCDNRIKYQDTLNESPAFINLSTRAIISALMLKLNKLFDKNSSKHENKVCSIKTLVETCRTNKDIFPHVRKIAATDNPENITEYAYDIQTVLDQADKKLSDLGGCIEHLDKQRNKVIAHNDAKYFHNIHQIEIDYPVQWGEIEDILEFCGSLINDINLGLTDEYTVAHFQNENDILNLLSLAQIGKKCEQKEKHQDSI